MPAKRPRRDWSIEEKIRILAKASTLTGAEQTDFLQRESVRAAEFEQSTRSHCRPGKGQTQSATQRWRIHHAARELEFETHRRPRELWKGHYSHGMSSSCGPAGATSPSYDVKSDGERFFMIKDDDQDSAPSRTNEAETR